MMTTVQLKDVTKQRLDILKKKYNASSYDEVIMRIIEDEKDTPKTIFGSLKGIGPWTKADRSKSKYE